MERLPIYLLNEMRSMFVRAQHMRPCVVPTHSLWRGESEEESNASRTKPGRMGAGVDAIAGHLALCNAGAFQPRAGCLNLCHAHHRHCQSRYGLRSAAPVALTPVPCGGPGEG